MISDEVLLYIISIGFGILGVLHFIFPKIVTKYSVEADLLNADVAVKMSGVLLIVCSVMLFTDKYWDQAFYALCAFLVISSLVVHKFWSKNTGIEQLSELLHFVKNLILAAGLWYIKDHLHH